MDVRHVCECVCVSDMRVLVSISCVLVVCGLCCIFMFWREYSEAKWLEKTGSTNLRADAVGAVNL